MGVQQNTTVNPIAYSANGLVSIVFGPGQLNSQVTKAFESANSGTLSVIYWGGGSMALYALACAVDGVAKGFSEDDKKSADWKGCKGRVVTFCKFFGPVAKFFSERPGYWLIGTLGIYSWVKIKNFF